MDKSIYIGDGDPSLDIIEICEESSLYRIESRYIHLQNKEYCCNFYTSAGRPKVDPDNKKSAYSVSLTPGEYKIILSKYPTLTEAILTIK